MRVVKRVKDEPVRVDHFRTDSLTVYVPLGDKCHVLRCIQKEHDMEGIDIHPAWSRVREAFLHGEDN